MKILFDYTRWKRWHWESINRCYTLTVDQDLFGKWTVTKTWGGKFSKIHSYKKDYCNIDQVCNLFDQVNKKRVQRNYQLMSS